MYPVPSSDFLLLYPKNTRFDLWYWVIELTFESWYHCTTVNYRDSSVHGYHNKTVFPCGVSPCPCSWDKTVCGQPVSSVARALSSPIGVNCLTLKMKVLWLLEMTVTVIKHIPEIAKSNYGIRFVMFVWLSIHVIFMKSDIWDFHAR